MQEIEVDAGERFRHVGLGDIADDAPTSRSLLEGHVEAGTAWVACDGDDRVIGFATSSIVDGDAHLDHISVIPAASGHGAGRSLIDGVLDWARAGRRDFITLTTFRDIPWNGPYYARLGFRTLAASEMGPGLTRIRTREKRDGLDIRERIAMRRSTQVSIR